MQVELFKKTGSYIDQKTGEVKPYTNFYLRCGDTLIPITPCYFADPKNDNRDYQYAGRKQILKAFAGKLPEKTGASLSDEKKTGSSLPGERRGDSSVSDTSDVSSDIPF